MTTKLREGQAVKWKCRPWGHTPFVAQCIIKDFLWSTLGGMKKVECVRIEPVGVYRDIFRYRKTTVVGVDKVSPLIR